MNDDPRDDRPEDGKGPGGGYPAPWQRRDEGAMDLDADQEGQASYIAGDEMSLDSKLRGGGQDQSETKAGQATRLCPACSTVTVFVDGKCTNCDYLLGSTAHEGVQEIRQALEGDDNNPAVKILLLVLIAVVVVILLFIGIPRFLAGNKQAADEATVEPAAEMYNSERTYAGTLNEIAVDDTLHTDIRTALYAGTGGWAAEGTDAYIYRYRLSNEVVRATSQKLRITAYVGGADAKKAAAEPGDVPFRLGTADLLDRLNATPGVEAVIRLSSDGVDDLPGREDIYIRYGYDFGLEHMNELQPIVDGLSDYYKENRQYPHLLSDKVIRGQIKTKKGYYYIPDGIGYLPVFRTDGSSNIIMGKGSGMESLLPEACIGYYLVKYTRTPGVGLDIHSDSAEDYYANKIAPFPYEPREPVHNIKLEPDGEPDGIACVIKDGVLQKD